MTITIHRGTHQIGGCATEFRTERTRIFVDFGAELPGLDGTQPEETISIAGLSEVPTDCDGVFFTHSHGDHIGNIGHILPDVPLYMGEASKEITLLLNRRLQKAYEFNPAVFSDRSAEISALERTETIADRVPVSVGDFTVTPYRVDHSAFDAYMFLIEAEGVRILHTGDFRDHGYTGGQVKRILQDIGQVDWLICEGTMLSRDGETVMTEQELEAKACSIIEACKKVFVLCSSTNIDRIRAFYKAKPYNCPAVCDGYQKDVLDIAEKYAPTGYDYKFQYVIPDKEWNYKLHNWMEDQGFVMFVRANDSFKETMEPYKNDSIVIYSMWDGYLQNPRIADFLRGHNVVKLHTSGHAAQKTLKEVCETVRPRRGVIPIHSETPGKMSELLPSETIVYLQDKQEMTLN